jgi:haloacetate dehalogenase
MALDLIEVMDTLGFTRFAVVGHDRGARVAYRLALDHPARVAALGVLDIVPTAEAWDRTDMTEALAQFHWQLLAQPEPLPERLIGAAPDFFMEWLLQSWAAPGFAFPPNAEAVGGQRHGGRPGMRSFPARGGAGGAAGPPRAFLERALIQ